MRQQSINVVDLFAGAGGTSTGVLQAAAHLGLNVNLVAINHWQIAIATHKTNHINQQHLCAKVEEVNPLEVVPGGRLRLLVASPECTNHSRARGGKPRNDQSRTSAWHILRWLSVLYVDQVLIENVPDFLSWGPLGADGHPLKSAKGTIFQAFLQTLRDMKYIVEYRILNCADYGAPTTRERLFIQAVRGRRKIVWPEPTHSRNGAPTLFGAMKPWRTAREIIDWSIPGYSIFTRKKPLVPNTLKRIFAGLEKFCGLSLARSAPNANDHRGNASRARKPPAPAATSRGAGALGEPFLVKFYGGHDACSLNEPLPSVTASYEHFELAQPFLLSIRGGNDGYLRAIPVNEPVPTVTGEAPLALVEPFLIQMEHSGNKGIRSIRRPMPAITSADAFGVCAPFLVRAGHGSKGRESGRTHPLKSPVPTITGSNEFALVQPFLLKYNGVGGGARSVDDPVDTLTAVDRFGLVEVAITPGLDGKPQTVTGIPVVFEDGTRGILDIRFRMLTQRELARAQSFPDDYQFLGTRKNQTKQIGNAVPPAIAEALTLAMLTE